MMMKLKSVPKSHSGPWMTNSSCSRSSLSMSVSSSSWLRSPRAQFRHHHWHHAHEVDHYGVDYSCWRVLAFLRALHVRMWSTSGQRMSSSSKSRMHDLEKKRVNPVNRLPCERDFAVRW